MNHEHILPLKFITLLYTAGENPGMDKQYTQPLNHTAYRTTHRKISWGSLHVHAANPGGRATEELLNENLVQCTIYMH